MRTCFSRCRFCANTMPTSSRHTIFMRSQLRLGSGLSSGGYAAQRDVGQQRRRQRLRIGAAASTASLISQSTNAICHECCAPLMECGNRMANSARKKKIAPSRKCATRVDFCSPRGTGSMAARRLVDQMAWKAVWLVTANICGSSASAVQFLLAYTTGMGARNPATVTDAGAFRRQAVSISAPVWLAPPPASPLDWATQSIRR